MYREIKQVCKKELLYLLRSPKLIIFELILPLISFAPLIITVWYLNAQAGSETFAEYTRTAYLNNYYIAGLLCFIFLDLVEGSGYLLEQELYLGTLEQIWLTPGKPMAIVMGWYSFLTIKSLIYLSVFTIVALFFMDLSVINIGLTLFLLLMLLILAFGFGIIIEAITLYFKQADAIIATIVGSIPILSCVAFPMKLLPSALQIIAKCLPTTYLFDLIKYSLSKSELIFNLQIELVILIASSIVFIILSIKFYHIMFRRVKTWGTIYIS